MLYDRSLRLSPLLEKKSILLLGPRATGKSTLIKEELSDRALVINLLKSDYFMKLSSDPGSIEPMIDAHIKKNGNKLVVIDEIQRIPELLNEAHRLIEDKKIRFLLTGSSARKLKRQQANLLSGRAWIQNIFPLTSHEITDFDLDKYLTFGGLPSIYTSDSPEEELDAYVQTYIKEEIMAEGLIRKLQPFSRFLKVAALSNSQLINFTAVGSDAQVPPTTVVEYFSLLNDTLIVFTVEPWTGSRKRKAIQTAKFYFFDTGITRFLAGTKHLDRNSNLYGLAFEQFIAMELRAYLGYSRIKESLCFWRTTNRDEVDFVIGEEVAIEVKASKKIQMQDAKPLIALSEEKTFKNFYLVSQDPITSFKNGIHFLHYEDFLKRLWSGKII